jgi:hypothetical protein
LGLENTEAALKEAEFAEWLTGTDPDKRSGVFYLRAMVSIERKDLSGARKYLDDAIMRAPHSYYAELARGWLKRLPSRPDE